MLSVSNLSVQFGKRVLFDEVNVTFTQGNCYGIIGANGAGKSTFLKILSGKQEPTSGRVILEPGKRMSVLEQDHYAYDDYTVLDTVIMGNKVLSKVKKEMDELYADYSDENAERIGELQMQFDEMNGWNAESDAVWETDGVRTAWQKTPPQSLHAKAEATLTASCINSTLQSTAKKKKARTFTQKHKKESEKSQAGACFTETHPARY